MLSKVNSMALHGLDGYLIDVQVDVSNGMPCWEIVGLPDTSVKEAKERVKTAIKNSGYELLSKRIIINLAPADTKKAKRTMTTPKNKCRMCKHWKLACGQYYCDIVSKVSPGELAAASRNECNYFESR